MALNLRLLTAQILTNNVQVLILCFSYLITTVTILLLFIRSFNVADKYRQKICQTVVRGHSTTTWTRRGGGGVSKKSTLVHPGGGGGVSGCPRGLKF